VASKTRVLEHFLPPKDGSIVGKLKFECKHCSVFVSSGRQYVLSYISVNKYITGIKIYLGIGIDKCYVELIKWN